MATKRLSDLRESMALILVDYYNNTLEDVTHSSTLVLHDDTAQRDLVYFTVDGAEVMEFKRINNKQSDSFSLDDYKIILFTGRQLRSYIESHLEPYNDYLDESELPLSFNPAFSIKIIETEEGYNYQLVIESNLLTKELQNINSGHSRSIISEIEPLGNDYANTSLVFSEDDLENMDLTLELSLADFVDAVVEPFHELKLFS